MLKQSVSRNHRPKRLKLINILQICLLLALCIWLLYQVKKSYDKKVALEDKSRQVMVLGRKDLKLNPKLEEILAEFKGHEDDEEEFDQESEDNKLLKGNKTEGGAADDELDGDGDQEKDEEEETEPIEDPVDEKDSV